MSPPVFLSYRRADEPYAAALAYAQLSASFAGDTVFLDTRFLRQRGDVSRQLLTAVAASRLVLAIIGPAWDDAERRSRLANPHDWVRRELVAADEAGKPIVPVLVDRTDVPRELPFAVPSWLDPVLLASTGFRDTVGALVELVRGHLGNPATRAHASADLVPAAVEAMLRHVLPGPQRRMGNDQVVARVVAGELGDREWLRFVATGNLPGRPNGSAVVWLTSTHLVVADLGPDLHSTGTFRIGLADIQDVRRTDGRRLWLPVSDLTITTRDGHGVEIRGFFAEEASELLDMINHRNPGNSSTGYRVSIS